MSCDDAFIQFREALAKRDLDAFSRLLGDCPGASELRDVDGRSLTHLAADADQVDIEVLDILLAQGFNINARDHSGETPLHLLVSAGKFQSVLHLLRKGADVCAQNNRAAAPLHYAALLTANFTDLLLDHHADIDVLDDFGRTPIMWSIADGNESTTRRLAERGARSDVFTAAGLGDVEALRAMVDTDPQLANNKDRTGNTPLHWGAWAGRISVASFLIERGSDINARNDRAETPLHVGVARYGGVDLIRLLLGRGAYVNAEDREGNTPLHRAARTSNADKIATLLHGLADSNALNHAGQSPLDLVISRITTDPKIATFIVANLLNLRSFLSNSYDASLLLALHGERLVEQQATPGRE